MSSAPARPGSSIATAVAGLALASALWLFVAALGFGMVARHVGREEAKARYVYPTTGGPDQQARDAMAVVAGLLLVISFLVALALTIAALCLWPQQLFAGKVLTVAAAALLLPLLACGVFLGSL